MSRLLVAQRALTVPAWVKDFLWRRAQAVPSLDLRFADNKSLVDAVTGASLVTFTRASSGTFVDSAGVLRTAVTNLKPFSNAILAANGYSVSNSTLTTVSIENPFGGTTASLFTLNVGANTGNNTDGFSLGSGITLTNSTAHAQSLFVKPAGTTVLRLRSNVGGGLFNFTLTGNGTAPSPSADLQSASIVPFAYGWYRVSWTFTTTTSAPGNRADYWAIKTDVADGTNGVYVIGAQLEQSATVGEYIPTTSVINSAPRFDHNPTTGESLGLLVEEAGTNLLLNSATLSTQSVTVTAVAHTLSFTGTGTITLTGASTAGPLVGTGAGEANRVSLTFTPTAGSLTLTVSGTVTNAQLEIGAFRTSYIATTGATATRAADVASITGSAFSSWYRQDEGTVFADCSVNYTVPGTSFPLGVSLSDGTTNNSIENGFLTSTLAGYEVTTGGVAQVGVFPNAGSSLTRRLATSFKFNDFAASVNGGIISADTSGTVPIIDRLRIGGRTAGGSTNNLFGTIKRLSFWPQRLPNSTLQSITQ